jgi:hypothetical protein
LPLLCRLIDDAFEWLCAHKFGGSGGELPEAPLIADASPVLPEPDPDDPEGFLTETAAMKAAMEESLRDKEAAQSSSGGVSSSGLREEFRQSVMLQELGWLGETGKAQVLEALRPLLDIERKCQRWWKHEHGVPGYFRGQALTIAGACRGACAE